MTAAALAGVGACAAPAGDSVETRVYVLTTGPEGGGFYPLGRQIAAALNEVLAGLEVAAVVSSGAVANVQAIAGGEADLGLTFADVAYLGHNGQLEPSLQPMGNLRGITVLPLTPVALAARPGLAIDSPSELKGRVVSVGPSGSGTALTARLILGAYGLDGASVHIRTLGFSEGALQLLDGQIDAIFHSAIDQASSLITATEGGAKLVPIAGVPVDQLRAEYPFLRPTSIPQELYPAMPHSTHTLGVDGLLICREDLDDATVYTLTKAFFDVFPQVAVVGQARRTNLELAPATPIPLHPGAARYYRERELLR